MYIILVLNFEYLKVYLNCLHNLKGYFNPNQTTTEIIYTRIKIQKPNRSQRPPLVFVELLNRSTTKLITNQVEIINDKTIVER